MSPNCSRWGRPTRLPFVSNTHAWYRQVIRRAVPAPLHTTGAPRWRQALTNVRATPSSPRTTTMARPAMSYAR